jgi:hypothetical protein
MKLFIRVKDGEAFEHPMFEGNFLQAFPDIDPENLPPEFARFIRVPQPRLDRFEVYEGVTYEWNGWAFTDVHHARPMNAGERADVIERIKAQRPNESWIWDEVNLKWLQPALPTTGGPWRFDRVALDWVPATEPPFPSWVLREDGLIYIAPVPRPQDGQRYRWDEPTLSWVPLNG